MAADARPEAEQETKQHSLHEGSVDNGGRKLKVQSLGKSHEYLFENRLPATSDMERHISHPMLGVAP